MNTTIWIIKQEAEEKDWMVIWPISSFIYSNKWDKKKKIMTNKNATELCRLGKVILDRVFVYLLFKTFVWLIKCNVDSKMIRLMCKLSLESPYNNKLHRSLEQKALMSKLTEQETRSRKALLGDQYRWQCRRKCSSSSIPLPHKQFRLLLRKLRRNRCSHKSLNLTLNRVKSFKSSIS